MASLTSAPTLWKPSSARQPATSSAHRRLNRRRIGRSLRTDPNEAADPGRTPTLHSDRLVVSSSSSTVESTGVDRSGDTARGPSVHVLALVPGEGSNSSRESPFQGAEWEEVLEHVGKRLNWTDERLSLSVLPIPADPGAETLEDVAKGLAGCDLAVGVGLHKGTGTEWLVERLNGTDSAMPSTLFFLDCHDGLEKICRAGGMFLDDDGIPDWRRRLTEWNLPGDRLAKPLMVKSLVQELWHRHSSEDLLYALLVLVNEYSMEVPLVSGQLKEKTDIRAILCMMGNCRQEVLDCVNNPECKAGLDCLETCAFNDQVCSYRCIVSYESPLFEAFSLCILQKHNCLQNSASIPMRPQVDAMTHFRGDELTWETSDKLFIGWLGAQPASWRVVAGKNPAYDYFPCQYQLFYPGKAKGSMWYEPVFKVTKYDGTQVWRRRKYRMRRAEAPGYYHFSVLDNGVISSEYWRIVDVADDLSWAIFYYSGAASVVGQTYQGSVFATPDGRWPDDKHLPRITASMDSAGIKMWELYDVDQSCCDPEDAPLDLTDLRPFEPLV